MKPTPFLKGVESVYMAYAAGTYDENILMVAYPKEADGGLFAVLTPFSYQVWLSMLICGAVHELAKLAITYLEKKMPVDSETIRYWRSIRFQFILNGTRVLMVAILSMAYASTVVSFLTVRKLNPIPNSIEDLAKYPDMELLAFRNHPIISAAQNAKSGHLKVLGDLFRQKPQLMMPKMNAEDVIEHVLNGGVFVGPAFWISWIIGQDQLKHEGKCRFMLSKPIETLPPLMYTFALQKDNPYKEIITEKLIRINDNGFESHLRPKPDAKYDDCKYPDDVTAKLTVIRLKDVAGAFIILVVGLVLASMAFLYEKMINFIQKKKKKPPPLGDHVP